MLTIAVTFKKALQEGKAAHLTAEIEVRPSRDVRPMWMPGSKYHDPAAAEDEKLLLPLQRYILSHPIPSDWEIRRNDREDYLYTDSVYFHNNRTAQDTALLWFDPLATECPKASLQQLPNGWKREVKDGKISNRKPDGSIAELPQKADGYRDFRECLGPGDFHSTLAFQCLQYLGNGR